MAKLPAKLNLLKIAQICAIIGTLCFFFYVYLDSPEAEEIDAIPRNIEDLGATDDHMDQLKHDMVKVKQQELMRQIKQEIVDSEYDKIKEQALMELNARFHDMIVEELLEKKIRNGLPDSSDGSLEDVFKLFWELEPETTVNLVSERPPTYFYYTYRAPIGSYNSRYLSEFLDMDESKRDYLKSVHSRLINQIRTIEYPEAVFEGDGIVINGGGAYLPNSVIAIRNLREIGSELPIELMLNDESEYDSHICESLLPNLNSKCVVISRIMGDYYSRLRPSGYESKMMGLFVSSFENVIMLDADNFPLKSPDSLLVSAPFDKFKCILWPDLWHRATSPSYYDVIDTRLGEPIRRGFSDPGNSWKSRSNSVLADLSGAIPDTTIELGQLVISKRHHYKALLLATYYNLNGNSIFYNLLCQGTYGEGDKETLIAALEYFGEKYHLVNTYPIRFGYMNGNMIQFDAEQDYHYQEYVLQYLRQNDIDVRKNLSYRDRKTRELWQKIAEANPFPEPDKFTIHVQRPKINPVLNALEPRDYQTKGVESRKMGFMEDQYRQIFNTLDYELKFYKISEWFACEADLGVEFWKDRDQDRSCTLVKNHVKYLLDTSNNSDMSKLRDLGV